MLSKAPSHILETGRECSCLLRLQCRRPRFNPWVGKIPWRRERLPTPDSLVAQEAKNQLAMRETWVQSLGWEDPLEKGKATPSSIFAWRIPWTIQSPWDRKESDTERLSLHFTSLPVFLPGEVHGQRSLEGYKSMRSQRVGSTQYI